MKQTNDNKNLEGFITWSKVCIFTAIITGVFGIILALLIILKEFTDLEVKAPYLYSKIFVWIVLAISLTLITFEVFCYVKARKYKKWIEKSENKGCEEETNDG